MHVPKIFVDLQLLYSLPIECKHQTPVLSTLLPIKKYFQNNQTRVLLKSLIVCVILLLEQTKVISFNKKHIHMFLLDIVHNKRDKRCLYPSTGQVYISRRVVFDESKFPFTNPLNAQSFKLEADHSSRQS